MDVAFWQTIISVALGAVLTFFMTVITDCFRSRREANAFNRQKRLEAYLEVFKILNDYLAHLEVIKTDPIRYCEQVQNINRMNVLNGIFASKRFEKAIGEYRALAEKGCISRRDREAFLNVMRQEVGMPLFERHTRWQRAKGVALFLFKRRLLRIKKKVLPTKS